MRLYTTIFIVYSFAMDYEAFQESTPLFRAIGTGDDGKVAALLAAGADPNECYGPDEEAALLVAAIEGRERIVEVLLAAGADVNMGDNVGYTPLMGAVCAASLPIVNKLLSAGADVNRVCTRSGATALHDAAAGNHLQIAQSLLAAGAEANAKENLDGYSPLMCAVQALAPQVVKVLLQNGADATAPGSRGTSPKSFIENELPYLWEPDKISRARQVQALLTEC